MAENIHPGNNGKFCYCFALRIMVNYESECIGTGKASQEAPLTAALVFNN